MEMNDVLHKVRRYIDREIVQVGELLVAVSGGADSTALLLIMKELGYKVEALHCNFHLRGTESDRDQAFVQELCRQQDVPLRVRHFQTEEVARQRGISIEMAARDLRYAWFREEIHSLPVEGDGEEPFVAVAHHRDDQAETLLLNLLRGTGLRGMAGMQPKHDGIIRPLLCLSREEILDYLAQRGQSYVTDSTNAERIAQRNRIRLDVIPLLQSINPAAVEHLSRACDNVRHSLPYYTKGIETSFREHGITDETFPLKALSTKEVGGATLLHEWLAGKGFNATQEAEMRSLPHRGEVRNGAMWHSHTHTVLRDREALLLVPRSSSMVSHSSSKDLLTSEAHLGAEASLNFHLSIHEEFVSCIGETGPNIAYFDADLLTAPIEVRPVREGDAFVPFGMKGRKLVSDYLTDRKVNRLQKAETFVATCGDDIIWLIGHRSDNRFRVTAATTRILKLSV